MRFGDFIYISPVQSNCGWCDVTRGPGYPGHCDYAPNDFCLGNNEEWIQNPNWCPSPPPPNPSASLSPTASVTPTQTVTTGLTPTESPGWKPSQTPKNNPTLSTGAIAGIVVGCGAVLLTLTTLWVYYCWRRSPPLLASASYDSLNAY